MASFKSIEEINVWKIAVDLAVEIYSLTGGSKEINNPAASSGASINVTPAKLVLDLIGEQESIPVDSRFRGNDAASCGELDPKRD